MNLEITLKLNTNEYPILGDMKKKELDKLVYKIFKTGYDIHFPSQAKIEQQSEDKKENNKLELLEASITKLIGISTNSAKKGNFGENVLEEIFEQRYGDIKFERKSQVAHSGDAWLHLPDNKVIMLESKNYTSVVNKDEVIKLQADMINHHIKWGIIISFNSGIQGMKELDFYTFIHNNENYFVISIANLSTDVHKLDLGLQIIRKLMNQFDNLKQFTWITDNINQSLVELNQIVQKNYYLRDSYYNMEKDIQRSLSNYHIILRDYQYDIEKKINEIIQKIQTTMDNSIKLSDNYQSLLNKYKDSKILPLLVRLIDIVILKNWIIEEDETGNYSITFKNQEILKVKIQVKKIILMTNGGITIEFNIGKEKENKDNFEFIKLLQS